MKKIISLAVGSAMLFCGSLAYSAASEFSGNLSSAQTLALYHPKEPTSTQPSHPPKNMSKPGAKHTPPPPKNMPRLPR